jgi:hypothetical protein
MTKTDGYKIAAAIHDLLVAIDDESSASYRDALSFNGMPDEYQSRLLRLVGELFDNEVIESGRRLPEIYNQAGYIGVSPERNWIQLHPEHYASGPNTR